ncbi:MULTISPECIES: hypothetical protein [unclassified Campylobacter]|nr:MULTISPECIES: hypothetical protein [unclassified Campylobacter]MDA3089935.1 hypothetical protein [Campylobacter sp. CS_ED2]MDA3079072.1 hypothetical protein [Campylobacter sp. CS_NA2]MDA3080637.1 hypothetical protein [Campylobacter sp. CS_NA1]MDA3085158.1 hypothetical protein [Campylobacter sp. CS_ED1]WBR51509.1 hypothetical protein PF026_01320 [Campylobacter sp. CS_NA3]
MKNLILSACITLVAVVLFYLINFNLLQKEKTLHSQETQNLQIQVKNLQDKIANLEANLQNSQNENQEIKVNANKAKSEISDELNKKIWDLENENRNLKLENITLKERLNLAKPSDRKFENQSLSIEIN